jgi:hypothetical protein
MSLDHEKLVSGGYTVAEIMSHYDSTIQAMSDEYGGWLPEWMDDELSSPDTAVNLLESWRDRTESFHDTEVPF